MAASPSPGDRRSIYPHISSGAVAFDKRPTPSLRVLRPTLGFSAHLRRPELDSLFGVGLHAGGVRIELDDLSGARSPECGDGLLPIEGDGDDGAAPSSPGQLGAQSAAF